jgi:hypothetical protein
MIDSNWESAKRDWVGTTTALKVPKYVGTYWISKGIASTGFQLTKKPNWLNRTMTRFLLGWMWEDNK